MTTPEPLDDRVAALRFAVNTLVDKMGEVATATFAHGGGDDAALTFMLVLIKDMDFNDVELAGLLAFAIRRLWHKRSDPVRPVWN